LLVCVRCTVLKYSTSEGRASLSTGKYFTFLRLP
jgi:hypothetical protein